MSFIDAFQINIYNSLQFEKLNPSLLFYINLLYTLLISWLSMSLGAQVHNQKTQQSYSLKTDF